MALGSDRVGKVITIARCWRVMYTMSFKSHNHSMRRILSLSLLFASGNHSAG